MTNISFSSFGCGFVGFTLAAVVFAFNGVVVGLGSMQPTIARTSKSVVDDRWPRFGELMTPRDALARERTSSGYHDALRPERPADRSSHRYLYRVYFEPESVANLDFSTWGVFRAGAAFHDVSRFRKAPARTQDKTRMPQAPATLEPLPAGCEAVVSALVDKQLARIPASCVAQGVRGYDERMFADSAEGGAAGRLGLV